MKSTKSKTIGDLINEEVRRQEMPVTKFAKEINCQRNNVYDIFNRSNMDIDLLKRISKVLGVNFFQKIADDLDLVCEEADNVNQQEQKAVSQFLDVVPKLLEKMGKNAAIFMGNPCPLDIDSDCLPDFSLPDYSISFTFGKTLEERMRANSYLSFEVVRKNAGCEVETCFNKCTSLQTVNIQLTYKTEEQWAEILEFAFEVVSKWRTKIWM
uniref:hypothetical protein n=1 Tax=Alloprevotella sp. TaxID=1872471 RepID=UPI004026840A